MSKRHHLAGKAFLVATLLCFALLSYGLPPVVHSQEEGADVGLLDVTEPYEGKRDSADPVYPGQSFLYTLIVTNTGPDNATNVVVKDWMPAGVSINNATMGTGEWMAGVPGDPDRPLTWNVGFMPWGRTVVMRINVTVLHPADRSLETWLLHNDAMVSSDTYDPNNANNLATEDTTVINPFVQEPADLKVIKFVKPDTTVLTNQPINYTIIVENWGPAPAYNVSLREDIIASGAFTVENVFLDPTRLDTGPATFSMDPINLLTLEFNLTDPLEPLNATLGGRWVIQIQLQASSAIDINNVATVFTRTTRTLDPNLSNNEDRAAIHVSTKLFVGGLVLSSDLVTLLTVVALLSTIASGFYYLYSTRKKLVSRPA